MLPMWKHLVGDVPANMSFYDDMELRKKVAYALSNQFSNIEDNIKLFQIQTRSQQEAARFINGDITMLALQVAFIRDKLYDLRKMGRTNLPKVVIEVPPWWSNDFKQEFITAIKCGLGVDLPEVTRS
jgi:hypothetical protein